MLSLTAPGIQQIEGSAASRRQSEKVRGVQHGNDRGLYASPRGCARDPLLRPVELPKHSAAQGIQAIQVNPALGSFIR